MKKEDILKKAQEENADEMERFIEDKSMIWAFTIMALCLIAFTIVKREMGQNTFDFTATIAAGASVMNFYRYTKLRNGKTLFAGIITGVGAVLCLIFFITSH